MSIANTLYQSWDKSYRAVFLSLADTKRTPNDDEYSDTPYIFELSTPTGKKIHQVVIQVDEFVNQLAKMQIELSNYQLDVLQDRIDGLQRTFKQNTVQIPADIENTVLFCDESDKLDEILHKANELLVSLYTISTADLLDEVIDFKRQFTSEISQIQEAKNQAVIGSLSSVFTKISTYHNRYHKAITVLIIAMFGVGLCVLFNFEQPMSFEANYLLYFYLNKLSIILLGATALGFLFKVRKELFKAWQIYQHKSALASSFINFQEQISKMPNSVNEEKARLNSKLLEITIEELGKNPIDKLDDKNKDGGDLTTLENNLFERIAAKLFENKAQIKGTTQ